MAEVPQDLPDAVDACSDQLVQKWALVATGIALFISEILGLLRNSPYRGILQIAVDALTRVSTLQRPEPRRRAPSRLASPIVVPAPVPMSGQSSPRTRKPSDLSLTMPPVLPV
jgi:hypothetical protein